MNIEELINAKKNYENTRLKIAKQAYKQIKLAIDDVENSHEDIIISCHWDGCITVDDELFHDYELRND